MERSIYAKRHQKLAAWLKACRQERELSIRDLGAKLGLHHSIVGKIETGERRLDVAEYIDYCKALDTNPVDGIKYLMSIK